MITINLNHQFWVEQQRRRKERGGGYRDLAASKIETFAVIVYFWKLLTIAAKGPILDITGGPDPQLKSVSITLFTLLERSFEKKLIRRALKIITFAFYYFNEYVVVTLTVSNGSANICCECETFKVLLTSVQIGFGSNEWVGVTCCHCRLLKEIVSSVKHCYS